MSELESVNVLSARNAALEDRAIMSVNHLDMRGGAISVRRKAGISSWALFALVSLTLLTPTFIFYTFGTASQAPGVAMIAATWSLLALTSVVPFRPDARLTNGIIIIGLILLAVFAHGLIASQIQANDLARMLQSLALAAISLIGATIAATVIFEAPQGVLRNAIFGALALLLVISLLGALQLSPYPAVIPTSNPIFPFTEPSHLALALAPTSIAAAVLSHGWRRLAILVALLLVAFFLRSMSTLVVAVLLAVVTIPVRLLIPGAILAYVAIPYLETEYFADRLDFNVYNTNLSNLVYLQGWELLSDATSRTFGWGLGFQQLGIGQFTSPTADVIYQILGDDLNTRDGGFTLSKFVSEFGIFGVGIIFVYVWAAVKSGLLLRLEAVKGSLLSSKDVIARSLVLGASVEIFVRGIGYFSPTIFLMLAAVIYLGRRKELF